MEAIERMSLKLQFASVSRPAAGENQNVDEMIEKCRERLRMDENYKQNDFDLDFIRIKFLGTMPEQSAKSPSNEDNSPWSDEDDLWREFDMSPTNDHSKSQFSTGPMMNFASQGSFSSFNDL